MEATALLPWGVLMVPEWAALLMAAPVVEAPALVVPAAAAQAMAVPVPMAAEAMAVPAVAAGQATGPVPMAALAAAAQAMAIPVPMAAQATVVPAVAGQATAPVLMAAVATNIDGTEVVSAGPLERPFFFSGRLLRIGLLHPAYQKRRKDKPDQRGYQVEKELYAHRRARKPRDGDGDSYEEIEDRPGDKDHRSDQLSLTNGHEGHRCFHGNFGNRALCAGSA